MKKLFYVLTLILALNGCSSNDNSKNNKKSKNVNPFWTGKWERQQRLNNGSLKIAIVSEDSIKFSLSASSGANTGELEGVAFVEKDKAQYSDSDKSENCVLEFQLFGDTLIKVTQKKGMCSAGLSVTYSGNYKNSKLSTNVEKTETLVDLGVFQNESENKLFKSLVGNNYQLFISSTQQTSEDEDMDNLNSRVYASSISGLSTIQENIIMIDSANNIWAAVINGDKVYYFTNSKSFKDKLPKTIDNWRQNFKDYEIIYK